MTKKAFSLLDDFELRGIWWLPNQPDNYVSGVLLFNNEETMYLELIGSFHDINPIDTSEFFRHETILGITSDNKICTLVDNLQIYSTIVSFGVPKTIYRSEYLFIGQHFNSQDDIRFSSLRVNFTNLENWMADNPFTLELHGKARSMHYTFPSEFDSPLEDLGIRIKSTYEFMSSSQQFRRITWDHIAFIEIIPLIMVGWSDDTIMEEFQDYAGPYTSDIANLPISFEHLGFDFYWKVILDINNLLTLLIGETVYPRIVKAFGDDIEIGHGRKHKEIIEIFFTRKKFNLKQDTHFFEMILPFPRIRDKISEVLRLWFLNAERLGSVYDLFFGTFYNPGMYLQFHFLSLMQALESFHRVTKGGKYLQDKEWEPYRNILTASVPKDLHPDFKASLKSRIRYGNEYSLRKRMKELVNTLDKATIDVLAPSPNYFSGIIVDTRNYFTHYDDELKDMALSGSELVYANQRLKVLIILLLLKELHIDESAIMRSMLESRKYSFLLGNPFNNKLPKMQGKEE